MGANGSNSARPSEGEKLSCIDVKCTPNPMSQGMLYWTVSFPNADNTLTVQTHCYEATGLYVHVFVDR